MQIGAGSAVPAPAGAVALDLVPVVVARNTNYVAAAEEAAVVVVVKDAPVAECDLAVDQHHRCWAVDVAAEVEVDMNIAADAGVDAEEVHHTPDVYAYAAVAVDPVYEEAHTAAVDAGAGASGEQAGRSVHVHVVDVDPMNKLVDEEGRAREQGRKLDLGLNPELGRGLDQTHQPETPLAADRTLMSMMH